MKKFLLKLHEKKEETADVISYIFEPDAELTWEAGQFMHYTLPHKNVDDRGNQRYFTISSPPQAGHVMLTTRFSIQRPSSFKTALYRLKPGDTIEAEGPDGDFRIENRESPQIFIAGGMGITPYHSILLDLHHRSIPMDVTLFYANRDEHFVFKNELEELKKQHPEFKIRYFVFPERIDGPALQSATPSVQDTVFYISGPEPMIDIFRKVFQGLGVLDFQIKRDYFPGYIWP
jgi:ferredoxin-NADP reductase